MAPHAQPDTSITLSALHEQARSNPQLHDHLNEIEIFFVLMRKRFPRGYMQPNEFEKFLSATEGMYIAEKPPAGISLAVFGGILEVLRDAHPATMEPHVQSHLLEIDIPSAPPMVQKIMKHGPRPALRTTRIGLEGDLLYAANQDGAATVNALAKDWPGFRRTFPTLHTLAEAQLEKRYGWQELTIHDMPPLADGTVLQAGYFANSYNRMSNNNHILFSKATIQDILLPNVNAPENAAHAPGTSPLSGNNNRDRTYESLSYTVASSTKRETIREWILQARAALPENTPTNEDGSFDLEVKGEHLRVLFAGRANHVWILVHKDNERAILKLKNAIPRASYLTSKSTEFGFER